MADFDSNLFYALAAGPCGETANGKQWRWTNSQIRGHKLSKDLFFEIVMLSAARYMIDTQQDEKPNEGNRDAVVNIKLTLRTGAADNVQNGAENDDMRVHHRTAKLGKTVGLETDLDMEVTSDSMDDDITGAIGAFVANGLSCPFPDPGPGPNPNPGGPGSGDS